MKRKNDTRDTNILHWTLLFYSYMTALNWKEMEPAQALDKAQDHHKAGS